MQIKLTVRDVSVEYDGDEEFFKSAVPDILRKMSDISGSVKVPPTSANSKEEVKSDSSEGITEIPNHSTNTIAKLLNAGTGPELIMAAVAKIIIVEDNATAKRSDITREMRAASSYYKKTYTNNLSAYLDTLTKADQLRLVSEGVYGLPAKQREQIEAKIRE